MVKAGEQVIESLQPYCCIWPDPWEFVPVRWKQGCTIRCLNSMQDARRHLPGLLSPAPGTEVGMPMWIFLFSLHVDREDKPHRDLQVVTIVLPDPGRLDDCARSSGWRTMHCTPTPQNSTSPGSKVCPSRGWVPVLPPTPWNGCISFQCLYLYFSFSHPHDMSRRSCVKVMRPFLQSWYRPIIVLGGLLQQDSWAGLSNRWPLSSWSRTIWGQQENPEAWTRVNCESPRSLFGWAATQRVHASPAWCCF